MGALLVWTIFGIVHVAAGLLALATLWWFQVTPVGIAAWLSSLVESGPAKAYVTIGGSLTTVLAGYAWLLRKAHRWAGGSALFDYLTKGI